MSMPFYSYDNRQGILPISWNDFFSLCKSLALAAASYQPDIILGIARGGLYAATLLSHMLQAELYCIRITSRFQDRVVYDEPRWLVRPPPIVEGRKVLIVDEISATGKTLRMVEQEVRALGAGEIRSAVMYAHEQGKDAPDYIGVISDALILNPWDREIARDGQFVFHPEYVFALEKQGMAPAETLLLGVGPAPLAKG
jgi:hypoxanthine phosphoribosyltransferase